MEKYKKCSNHQPGYPAKNDQFPAGERRSYRTKRLKDQFPPTKIDLVQWDSEAASSVVKMTSSQGKICLKICPWDLALGSLNLAMEIPSGTLW